MIASIFFMPNLVELEEISAKSRLERNGRAGQSISLPGVVRKRAPELCCEATAMPFGVRVRG
jgi:hypothetical protein